MTYDQMKRLFKDIAGTDMWVMINQGYIMQSYIKVTKFYNTATIPVIYYQRLPAWWSPVVAGDNRLTEDDYADIENVLEDNVPMCESAIDCFTVCEPVELMTTDEMWAVFDDCIIL